MNIQQKMEDGSWKEINISSHKNFPTLYTIEDLYKAAKWGQVFESGTPLTNSYESIEEMIDSIFSSKNFEGDIYKHHQKK